MANEKRLIDANALKGDFMFLRKMWSGTEIMAVIDEAPTVDAVEVVRCCQCKHHKMCEDGTVLCKFHSEYGERDSRDGSYSIWMEPDDFCSYGERREGE